VVEVALVLPILLTLFFGAIDFSRANSIRNTLENAAYEGARRAIVPGATAADVQQAAMEILTVLSIEQATITIVPNTITDATTQVTVSISVPLGSNLYASSQILSSSTLTKSCSLTREQFAIAGM
jgi:Flp pilus assembly protein TadG